MASLLLHEGRSPIYVARQLGHGAGVTMGTYGHVIDELEDAPRMPAEDAIRQAREERFGRPRSPSRSPRPSGRGRMSPQLPVNTGRPDQDSNLGPTP